MDGAAGGSAALARLRPTLTATNAPFWDALLEGRLTFQRCRECGNAWLPAREECPACLETSIAWERASGAARLVSWVTYHVAFNAAFSDRLPYTVAIVALEEGPRMISNIVGFETESDLRIEASLEMVIEHEGEVAVPRFRLAGAGRKETRR